MEVRRILNAGVVIFVEASADPPVHAPDMVEAVAGRYKFWGYPKKPSEFNIDDTSAGAAFQTGMFGQTPILNLKLYRMGISAEASDVSTDKVEEFLDDLINFGGAEFGLKYNFGDPVRKAFNSSVEIQLSESFSDRIDEAFSRVGGAIDQALTASGFAETNFHFTGMTWFADPASKPLTPNRFVIERRVGYARRDNVFFSEGPLSTADHLRVLELAESLS